MSDSNDPLAALLAPHPGSRVATIGTFDGVHRGHQRLISHARQRAEAAGLPFTVITFDVPPAAVLRPDLFPGAIVPLESKIELLRHSGADEIIVLPFTLELSRVSAEAFMDVLAGAARVVELYTGEGFALGYKRLGTVDVLAGLAAARGIRFEAIRRLTDRHGVVSSSEVRQSLARGDVTEAAVALGRWFRIEGEVVHGAQVGRTIGYPTANILPPTSQVQLADGIYATSTHLPAANEPVPSMTYIGTRPALNTGIRQIETHLLDFDGDLYGQVLAVDFVRHLRPDSDFPTVNDLIAQLHDDEARTRHVLASHVAPV